MVSKSVPSGCVVAGNPARILCSIGEYREKALDFDMETGGMAPDEKRERIRTCPNRLIKKANMKNGPD